MRMSALTCLGLSAAALLAASCAPAVTGAETAQATSSPRQCFSVQQVSNFRQGRPDQIFLRVGRSDVYELNNPGGCRDVDFATRLGIVSDIGGAGGTRLCTGDWARIIVPDMGARSDVCRVSISRKLTEAEVAALPSAHRP